MAGLIETLVLLYLLLASEDLFLQKLVHVMPTLGDKKRAVDDGLFFVLRDDTAGKTTYNSGRFLYVEKKPAPGEAFTLDLNRVYNPPCAFSEYTTCPLPPKQNVLKVRIDAGEKYPPKHAAG